jgi:DNA-binding response OmpR family regulator
LVHSRSQITYELKSELPETNLVDVHIGRRRRKVDASSDPPMISSVRGVGFIHRVPFGSA